MSDAEKEIVCIKKFTLICQNISKHYIQKSYVEIRIKSWKSQEASQNAKYFFYVEIEFNQNVRKDLMERFLYYI